MKWFLLAGLLLPMLGILTLFLGIVYSGRPIADLKEIIFFNGPEIITGIIIVQILYASISEEPGWRGFGTPHLLTHYSPLASGLIIGFFWHIWHYYPWELLEIDTVISLSLLKRIALALILIWIYCNSQGSLIPALMLHAAGNATPRIFMITESALSIYCVLIIVTAVCIVFAGKMWEKGNVGIRIPTQASS